MRELHSGSVRASHPAVPCSNPRVLDDDSPEVEVTVVTLQNFNEGS